MGKIIGEGAFSKVKAGKNTKTGQKVAVKILNEKQDLLSMQNKSNEISLLSRLDHPNIIKLIKVYTTDSKTFVVM